MRCLGKYSRHKRSEKRKTGKAQRSGQLADKAEDLDEQIWQRMPSSVKVATGKSRFGLLTVLTLILRWPDWQTISLHTRGFRVAGIVEPSNMYPGIDSKVEGTLHDLPDEETADVWNSKLSSDNKAYDHDTAVWDTAKEQLKRHLLSGPLTKLEVDNLENANGEAYADEAFGRTTK